MDLPINTSALRCVVTEPCAPRMDRETGQQRTDKTTGRPVFDTGLMVGDGEQSVPVRVKTFAPVNVPQMAPVTVKGLTLTLLLLSSGDKVQYFTAEEIIPAGDAWGPAAAGYPAGDAGTATQSGKAAGSASSASSASSGSRGGGGSGSPGNQGTGAAGKAAS